MSSENVRGFAWINEDVDHGEEDHRRAESLMRRWSSIRNEREQRGFQRQFDAEEGRGDWEPDECESCGGTGLVPGTEDVICTAPGCESGYDMRPVREAEEARRKIREDEDLELEIIEEKLSRIGARPMRPYEHWNEDERYVQYMEEGRFGDYSD